MLAERYQRDGYVSGLPVYTREEMVQHNASFDRLRSLLHPDETPYVIDGWEKHNRWLYDLAMEPRILDLVEQLLGPDFYQWGSNMMCKDPEEALYVPWHQDLRDWPLSPPRALTVWIAFDDVDQENGCLNVIPGSHLHGLFPHLDDRGPPEDGSTQLFPFRLDPRFARKAESVPLILRAGEVSIHDCRLVHGSAGNRSARRRLGFSVCYAATEVVCDLSFKNQNGSWADFAVFLCRGVDRFRHNPYAEPPISFGRTASRAYRMLDSVTESASDRREARRALGSPEIQRGDH